MRDLQETLPYAELMPAIYRFAFLMTGCPDDAAEVLRIGVERAARTLRHVRDVNRAKRWLFSQARQDCSCGRPASHVSCRAAGARPVCAPPEEPVPLFNDPPRQLALSFATLPEPERCALSLFYLYLFTPAELGEILDLRPRELGLLLSRGRTLLQRDRTLCGDFLAQAVPVSV